MKDIQKLRGFVILKISLMIMSLLFSCQDKNTVNVENNTITFTDNKSTVKVFEKDFNFKEDKNQFLIKIINHSKWDKIKHMEKPQINITFQDSLNIIAYPLEVLSSSSNKKYFYPIDSHGRVFFDKKETLIITKNTIAEDIIP